MSVTSVTEDWSGLAFNGQVDLNGAMGTLPRKFIVCFDTSDAAYNRPILALDASAGGVTIPDWWDVHPGGTDYFVRRKSVAPFNGPLSWIVTVEYEYMEDPLEQRPSIQVIPQGKSEAIDRAIEVTESVEAMTKNLCNSADEPFDPPIQEEFYDQGIIITRNEGNIDLDVQKTYLNKVNSDAFTYRDKAGNLITFAAGKVLCKNIQAEERRHGQTWYFEVTYEFVVREDGWKRRVLDQGFRTKADGEYTAILDTANNPITQPAKLNGSGAELDTETDPVFLEFQTKYTKSFAWFNFS